MHKLPYNLEEVIKMKRKIVVALIFAIILNITAIGAELPQIEGIKAGILIDSNTGKVLYAQNEHEQFPPASITKIMSLILIAEAIDSGDIALTDTVPVSLNAMNMGGSQIWLEVGELMTVDELLKAVTVASANDATVALAELVSGSEDAFVAEMNAKAKELGMTNTTFMNSAGLDEDGHLSTAYDIALMSRELIKYDVVMQYTTIWMDSLRGGEMQLVNTNKMIRFYDGATGLKTGTTDGAGSCLAASAMREDLHLVSVVLGADSSDVRFGASTSILDFGFANYCNVVHNVEEVIETVPISGGVLQSAAVEYSAQNSILMEKAEKENLTYRIVMEESLQAPVYAGDKAGEIIYESGGEEMMTVEILLTEDVREMSFWDALSKLLASYTDKLG